MSMRPALKTAFALALTFGAILLMYTTAFTSLTRKTPRTVYRPSVHNVIDDLSPKRNRFDRLLRLRQADVLYAAVNNTEWEDSFE
jgi:hypothetical protein